MRAGARRTHGKAKRKMKKNTRLALAAVLAVAFGNGMAFAAGYGINEGSARGNAMGTEVTADPVSPSIMYNNVAGLTELPGTQVEVGATFIKPRQTVTTDTPQGNVHTHGNSEWWTLPTAYASQQINDRWWAGVGLFTRVGLGSEFPENWPGRYSNLKAQITSMDVNPSVAFKVTDTFSLGLGLRVEYFDFTLMRAVPTGTPFVDPDAKLKITGDNYGLGFNAGAYWKPAERLAFGVAYESEIVHEINGDYKVTMSGQHLQDGTAYGDFPSPAIFRLGTSIGLTEKWKLNLGMNYVFWSCYDALTIHFDPALLGKRTETTGEKRWHDTFRWQAGTEYKVADHWALRFGYIYDKTPDPDYLVDYMVPANNRHLFSFGAGWDNGTFFADAGYTYVLIEDRTVHGHIADGVWDGKFQDGDAHMVGASVGYRF